MQSMDRTVAGGDRARDSYPDPYAPEPALHALAARRSPVPDTARAVETDLVVEARDAAIASRFLDQHKSRHACEGAAVHAVHRVVWGGSSGRDDAFEVEVREATSGHIVAHRVRRARHGCQERGEGGGGRRGEKKD